MSGGASSTLPGIAISGLKSIGCIFAASHLKILSKYIVLLFSDQQNDQHVLEDFEVDCFAGKASTLWSYDATITKRYANGT